MAARKTKYKFKQGDRVKITGNTQGCHHIAVGTVGTITGPMGNGYYRLQEFPNWNVPTADLELVPCTFDKDSLDKEMADLEAKMALLNSKLAFLEETGQETGCDKEFRVYQTMTLFENENMTKQEKARAIAALLESD